MTTNKPAILSCRHNTAGTIFIILGITLTSLSCTSIYKFLGLTEQQTADQVKKDQDATTKILDTGREQLWQIITAATAGVGTILSGLLAKWLGTERKITTALITGIESTNGGTVKERVQAKATASGIEPKLNARVRALT